MLCAVSLVLALPVSGYCQAPEHQEAADLQETPPPAPDSPPVEQNTPPASESGNETVSQEGALDEIEGSGDMLSLDLKGIDIIELFKILSLKMGVTIVPSRGVGGRVNIFLNNLSLNDALDVILLSQDLACEKTATIISVMTSGEYEKLYGKRYNEKRKIRTLKLSYSKPSIVFNALSQIKSDIGKIIVDESTGVLILIDIPEKLDFMEATVKDLDRAPQTEVFDIKYAKTSDVKTHLTSAITSGAGEVYADERSNKVIVSDLPEKMKKIKSMVKAIDQPTPEVFIEAEIVQITLKDEYQRGINWEDIISSGKLNGTDFKGTFPVSPSFSPSPALTTADLQMVLGVLASDNYTLTLQLLSTFGDTKILSRPRIAALNNQEAKIMVGAREAYVTQTLSQGDTTTVTSENVEFIDVGVKLNVVPTINDEGFIILKIKPEVSSVRETITTAMGSRIPIVETSEAETVVKVKDGTMIMIAGLMKDDQREDSTGLPFLSRIPVLGSAFGSRADYKKKTELVIFIRPHIISGDVTVSSAEAAKHFPPGMVPDDMKKAVISQKVDEMTAGISGVSKPAAGGSEKTVISEKNSSGIQEKMKGIIDY
jgi:MSHA type pilus biogenesis protein MshL